jgi:molybdopterin-guanine dinucleotide biosynthesis protein A
MRSAVILYGGKSARMGADKGKLEFRGKPLFQWVLESISQVVDEIVLSVSHEEQIELIDIVTYDVSIALDERPGLGPMGGLLSGIRKARGEYVAVTPVDAPLISPQLYELLFEKVKGNGAAVPKIRGYWEPLVAVYKGNAMISAIGRAIAGDTLDIRSTFPHLDIVEVKQHEIEAIDPDLLSFNNINTMKDLEILERTGPLKQLGQQSKHGR